VENGILLVVSEQIEMWMEVVVVSSIALYQCPPGETDKNLDYPLDSH
jgi:hypothetical protein